MDQLVTEVSRRTGLSHEQAQQAVQAVLEVVKGRLPPSMAGQLDALLGAPAASGAGSGGLAQQAEGLLGGMLGGSSSSPAGGAPAPAPGGSTNPSGTQTE